MKYLKPQYYDWFECVAGECPDTCCAGWQIMIDDESLEKYSEAEGPFRSHLHRSIDWKEGAFKQKKGRCAFLNENNLCDLYTALGKDSLCKTCRMYPRHVEEFDGLRELSLSLSCPVAARMILTCKEGLRLIEEETDEPEELADEFEEFDFLLFSQLQDARNVMFRLLSMRRIPIEERMERIVDTARKMQECIDEERYFEIDDVIREFEKLLGEQTEEQSEEKLEEQKEAQTEEQAIEQTEEQVEKQAREQTKKQTEEQTVTQVKERMEEQTENQRETKKRIADFQSMRQEFMVLQDLERLRPEWSEALYSTWKQLFAQDQEEYNQITDAFSKAYGSESPYREEWNLFTENLFGFFLLTYFCGAVYDDWIYSKAALARFSVRRIQNVICAEWAEGRFDADNYMDNWILVAYRYAREIEHSDENLNMLEEWLQMQEFH